MAVNAILPSQVLADGASDGDLLTVQADGSVAFETPAGGGGISTLNTLTGATQTFATATTGTDFAITSSGTTHTFSIPDASETARGLVTTGTQTFAGAKTFTSSVTVDRVIFGANNELQDRTLIGKGFTVRGFGSNISLLGSFTVVPFYSNQHLNIGHPNCKWVFGTQSQTDADTNRLVAQTVDGVHLRNTSPTSATELSVYNTFTSATSYERLDIGWDTNVATINTAAGSAGGTKRGMQICSAATDELGFFGATPVDQPATVADPSGGSTVDTEARAAISAVIDRLQELGLIA